MNARAEERNRIIADLSHSIKNLIATIIDPLQHLKQASTNDPQVIDNAIRGANLIREIVNAMNLSFKGSITDFHYDARHNDASGAMSIATIILESIKYSTGNMFDGKYFEKHMRRYFPSRDAYTHARIDWSEVSSDNDLERISTVISSHFLDPDIAIDGSESLVMGNEKGSAIKLLILVQEIILNAIKYAAFTPRDQRFLRIRFSAEDSYLAFFVENSYDPAVKVKSSGLGHVIIKNFATLLGSEPEIRTENNRYAVTIRFPHFWKKENT